MNSKTIDLAPFLGEIENIISSISHDRLKNNVIAYAKDLAPAKRFEFLQIIALDDEMFDNNSPEEYVPDKSLVEDARIYLDNIKEGVYDHLLDINKPDDVPEWVDDMDILFDRADEAFMYNNRKAAAAVYETLLEALHIAEDIAVEHQLYSAQDIIITAITEAKTRFFRSLYETSPAKKRAEVIFSAMRKNFALGNARCGLQDMKETSTSDLEDWVKFLSDWTALLKKEKEYEDEFEKSIRLWLLRESVFLADGFDGLYNLAEEQGDTHPEIYYDLVAYFVKAGELKNAENAARKGIDNINLIHQKAVLADWIAELASRDNDNALAVQSRKEAWRYEPTHERMVNWFNTIGGVADEKEIKEEIAFLKKQDQTNQVRLICMLELLIGEYDLPRKALITADPLGWRPGSHPGSIVLPFLMLAGSGVKEIPDNSSLKIVTEEMKSMFVRWQVHMLSGKKDQPLKTYLDFLLEAMKKYPVDEKQKDLFLATARTVILDRLRAIVTQELEHLFPNISHFAIAFAEACFACGENERGMKLITNIRNMYIRQTSLRNEMRNQFNSSSLLPHLTPQGFLND